MKNGSQQNASKEKRAPDSTFWFVNHLEFHRCLAESISNILWCPEYSNNLSQPPTYIDMMTYHLDEDH